LHIFVVDGDDAKDDGDETPGMFHVILLLLASCGIFSVLLLFM